MVTKQDQSLKKRDNIQYYDVFFGLFNSFVMGFLIIIMQKNLILVIVAYAFTLIMVVGIIFTFKRENPFYILYLELSSVVLFTPYRGYL